MINILELIMLAVMIYLSFWSLRPIQFHKFMPYNLQQAMVLKTLLAIGLGFILTQFFIRMMTLIQSTYQ